MCSVVSEYVRLYKQPFGELNNFRFFSNVHSRACFNYILVYHWSCDVSGSPSFIFPRVVVSVTYLQLVLLSLSFESPRPLYIPDCQLITKSFGICPDRFKSARWSFYTLNRSSPPPLCYVTLEWPSTLTIFVLVTSTDMSLFYHAQFCITKISLTVNALHSVSLLPGSSRADRQQQVRPFQRLHRVLYDPHLGGSHRGPPPHQHPQLWSHDATDDELYREVRRPEGKDDHDQCHRLSHRSWFCWIRGVPRAVVLVTR